MANANSTPIKLIEVQKSVIQDKDRSGIALEATYEIDALATLIINASPDDDDYQGMLFAVQRMTKRVKQLNDVIMSAVGDPLESNESLKNRM